MDFFFFLKKTDFLIIPVVTASLLYLTPPHLKLKIKHLPVLIGGIGRLLYLTPSEAKDKVLYPLKP